MPARSAGAALGELTSGWSRAVSTVTRAILTDDFRGRAGGSVVVHLHNGKPVGLRGARSYETRILLTASVGRGDDDSMFAAEVTGYFFELRGQDGGEVVSYHWHPSTAEFAEPHLHVGPGAGQLVPEIQKAHLPTGNIALNTFVALLIRQFGVRPLRRDWKDALSLP